MLTCLTIHHQTLYSYSITISIKQNQVLPYLCAKHSYSKRTIPGKEYKTNQEYTTFVLGNFYHMVFSLLMVHLLLLQSGDVHPNPGPSSVSSDTSDNMSRSSASSILDSINLSRHLSFVHHNVQSIVPKLDMILAEFFDFDVLAFTETWLNPNITSDDISLISYHHPERKDRVVDNHGGVIVYIKDSIHYVRRRDLEPNGVECIWVELTLRQKHVLFGVFYRPPSADALYFSSIEDSIHLAVDTGINDIIITGDFNYNMLNAHTSNKIKSICEQFSLTQTIDNPTHFTEHSSSLIDIILTNNETNMVYSGVRDPFLNQEIRFHCPVFGILNFTKPKFKSYTRHTWSYDRGDYNLLREKAADTNWNILSDPDINIHTKNITDHIISISKACIPNRLTRIKPDEPLWMNTNIKRYIRKRKRAYKQAKRTNIPSHWRKFRAIRNRVITMIRESKKTLNETIENKLNSNTLTSRDWWSTLKSVISPTNSSSIPPLENNGQTYTDNLEKANLLNNYFREQTLINDDNVNVPDVANYDIENELSSIILTPAEIEIVLKSLPVGKAVGPDGISNKILRELSVELSLPFCSLFNQSLQTGVFPDCWKISNVCPIPKSGNRSSISNYRPVSLLCTSEKVFERTVFKHIFNHFQYNNILTPLQSGFIPGDSTVNQLTYLYDSFSHALDFGKEVRVVFCDISKAFDRVWHEGLLKKLEAAGITGHLLTWFRSYLSDRRQRVVLPGVESAWNFIRAGVPQGSILGPLLFLLFINDIVTDIGSNIRLFADDTSLFIIVENPDMAAELLNMDLEKIMEWAKRWLVTFNPTKTESLLISRKINQPVHPPLFMDNQIIEEVSSHKHLGIFLSNDCSWHKHIDYVKEKAWVRINVMRRLKFRLNRKSLETIYFSFIRPLLEYADVIWDNCTYYEKLELDKIQSEAARIVSGATKLVSLHALYEEVGWESLEKRRRKHKLLLLYKMFNNLSPLYLCSLIPPTVDTQSSYNLRNAHNIRTIHSRTTQYFNSFLPSTIREWNTLPLDVRNCDSINSFKRKLNSDMNVVPKYFYTGNRKAQVLHVRIRTKCSSLNNDLYQKGINESPLCLCGHVENADHFLMKCHNYQAQRVELVRAVSQHTSVTLQTLLFGNNSLPMNINIEIFEAVQTYIVNTKRF